MNFSPEQLKNSLRKIRLTDDERLYMRRILERNIETYTQPITSPFARTAHRFVLRPMQIMAVMMVVLITSGTGLSYASSETLPGDLLYGFKISITEELPGLVMNDNERASYEVTRAVKRLEETAQLALVGRLDYNAERIIREQITQHTNKASQLAQKVRTKNPEAPITIAANITNKLSAHSKVLSELQTIKKINGELTAILATTQDALLVAAQNEKDGLAVLALENTEESQIRITRQREAVQSKLTLIEDLVATSSLQIENDIETIARDLEMIDTKPLEGETEASITTTMTSSETTAVLKTPDEITDQEMPIAPKKDSLLDDPIMVKSITEAITTINELYTLSLELEDREQYTESFNVLQEALNKAQSILSLISVQEKYSQLIEDNVLIVTPEITPENKIKMNPTTDAEVVSELEPAQITSKPELNSQTQIETSLDISSQKMETSTPTRLRE